jgi:hypothetical protein
MRPPKQFLVYIMTNGPKSAVLYTSRAISCLAAQEQTDIWLLEPLQPDATRPLRALFLSRCCNIPRKGNQRLAAQQENQADRIHKSAMGGLGRIGAKNSSPNRLQPLGARSLAPLDKTRGLRDDASGAKLKVD